MSRQGYGIILLKCTSGWLVGFQGNNFKVNCCTLDTDDIIISCICQISIRLYERSTLFIQRPTIEIKDYNVGNFLIQ